MQEYLRNAHRINSLVGIYLFWGFIILLALHLSFLFTDHVSTIYLLRGAFCEKNLPKTGDMR